MTINKRLTKQQRRVLKVCLANPRAVPSEPAVKAALKELRRNGGFHEVRQIVVANAGGTEKIIIQRDNFEACFRFTTSGMMSDVFEIPYAEQTRLLAFIEGLEKGEAAKCDNIFP